MRIPILMAFILVALSLLIDIYIWCDIRKNYPRRRFPSRLYGLFAVAGWIFIAVCLLLPRRDAEAGISFQMWGIYSYLSLLIPKIIFCLFSLAGLVPAIWKGRTLRLGKWVGLPLSIIIFLTMWWGAMVTRNNIDIVNVEFSSPKLPAAFDGYRIVQISDLHTGTWGNDTRFIERLVDSVNAQKPDLILFTGDIVNRQSAELAPFLGVLSRLHARDGVYSVLGNHDYGDYVDWPSAEEKRANLQLLKDWQRQIGWKLLNNSHTQIISEGDTIQLIGVENWGEPPFHQYGHLIEAYPISRDSICNLNDNRFKILMTHNPEHWRMEVSKISNIDLTLSGHTHAMQTEFKIGNWKWSPAVMRYPLWGGMYTTDNPQGEPMSIYVNIGAGEVGMPFRIGATPEVTVITLRN